MAVEMKRVRVGDKVNITGSPTAHIVKSKKANVVVSRCDRDLVANMIWDASRGDYITCEKCIERV